MSKRPANIYDILRSVDGGGDLEQVVKLALQKIISDEYTPEEQRDILHPAVREVARRTRRNREKHREDVAFSESVDDLSALRKLRDEKFLDPGSKTRPPSQTTWGQATDEQHDAREHYLRTVIIGPTMETANRHAAAARLIRERGVTRLADLPEFTEVTTAS
jgi:hypothetical protein